jgi:hypothetical protein
MMACPPICGAAAAVFVSEPYAMRHQLRSDVFIAAQAMTTDRPNSFDSHDMMQLVGYEMRFRIGILGDRAGHAPSSGAANGRISAVRSPPFFFGAMDAGASALGEIAQFSQRDREHRKVRRLGVAKFSENTLHTLERGGVERLPRGQHLRGAATASVQHLLRDGALQPREVVAEGGLGQALPVAVCGQAVDLVAQPRQAEPRRDTDVCLADVGNVPPSAFSDLGDVERRVESVAAGDTLRQWRGHAGGHPGGGLR